MDTASVTATENPAVKKLHKRGASKQIPHLNGLTQKLQPLQPIKQLQKGRPVPSKYKHVVAIHYEPKTSCLSHDSQVAPSFLGFRNLMVIVLSTSSKLKTQLRSTWTDIVISCR